jgi:hypothetical protein
MASMRTAHLAEPEPGAAVLLRHEQAEVAGVGERLPQAIGERVRQRAFPPVAPSVRSGGEIADGVDDQLLFRREFEAHGTG